MKLVTAFLTVLLLMFAAMAMATDATELPNPNDKQHSCEVSCAYAEMGYIEAICAVRKFNCQCGFEIHQEVMCSLN